MADKVSIDGQSKSPPGKTLSLKCPCGYVKHDVMHIGTKLGKWNGTSKPLNFCGGLWIVNETGQDATCKLCGASFSFVDFNCSFCGKETRIPVNYREASASGRTVILQMSVHKTIVFC